MNRLVYSAALALISLLLSFCGADAANPPAVRIRVAQYANSLDIVMPKGGQWLSGNRKGSLKSGKNYRIEGRMAEPAVRKYHLMVGSAALSKPEMLAEVEGRFKQFKTHRFIAGQEPAPGYPDNRIVFVGVGIFDDEEKAKEQQDKLAAEAISSWVFFENIRPAQGSLAIYQGKKKIFESRNGMELVPTQTITLKKAEFAKGFSWHGFENRHFSGKIFIGWGFENSLDCVEQTDLEKLIVGIVPSEISSKAPDSALQAQAVAARGEMLSKRGTRHFNEGYDFCSEQQS